MRVLVLGANGFLGTAIVTALREAGIEVRGAVRDPEKLIRRHGGIEAIAADLRDPATHEPGHWRDALDDIDAVVNAAGVLQPRRKRDYWAVHLHAPAAIYAACGERGVERVIHVSAIGVEEAETLYARSKGAGDQALMTSSLSWTVLRPAVIVGDGSYGGSSLLRAIAAFPWVTPVIGDGGIEIDFIDRRDLARAIVELLRSGAAARSILAPAGPDRLTLAEAVSAFRRWLGLRPRPIVGVPMGFVRALARMGDLARVDPMTTTALAQFEARLTGDPEGFTAATGITARGLGEVLAERPSESQDLWHARLYLIRPLIRLVLVALWLVSGLLGVFADPASYLHVLRAMVDDPSVASALAKMMGVIDLTIAAALLRGWRLKILANIQFALVLGYTITLTALDPSLWGDPFGGLLKNFPILALIAVHRILEEER